MVELIKNRGRAIVISLAAPRIITDPEQFTGTFGISDYELEESKDKSMQIWAFNRTRDAMYLMGAIGQ